MAASIVKDSPLDPDGTTDDTDLSAAPNGAPLDQEEGSVKPRKTLSPEKIAFLEKEMDIINQLLLEAAFGDQSTLIVNGAPVELSANHAVDRLGVAVSSVLNLAKDWQPASKSVTEMPSREDVWSSRKTDEMTSILAQYNQVGVGRSGLSIVVVLIIDFD